jgi:hypothetical protein
MVGEGGKVLDSSPGPAIFSLVASNLQGLDDDIPSSTAPLEKNLFYMNTHTALKSWRSYF